MKRMIIMLVLGALAFVAQANIVNGTFDIAQTNLPPIGATLSGNPIGGSTGPLNDGWGTNNYGTTSSSAYMQIVGGVASRNTGGAAQIAGVAQFYTDSQVGALKLQYDMQVTDANSSDKVYIQLYGYKYSGTFSASSVMTATDGAILKINSTGAFGASTNWTVTALVNYIYSSGTLAGGVMQTGRTLDFNVTSGQYDMYGIRMTSTGNGTGDVVVFDNVSVIPEPATVGMLGLGALLTLLFRRMRR